MKSFTIINILLVTMFFVNMSIAKASTTCTTPRGDKEFIINGKVVEFNQKSFSTVLREVASTALETNSNGSVDKIIVSQKLKYQLHIEDNDSYVLIRNQEGHEVFYPLTCTKSNLK